ncbi:Short chain dehydrogenase andI [Pseudocercospora fuligena]|nr:Short chain dehydrogenase andI [Pseudocercospora fuligena]
MFTGPGSGYLVSKFAELRFTEVLDLDCKSDGLITFSYHPGGVDTELSRHLPKIMQENLIDTPQLGGDTMVWLTAKRREWLCGRYVSCNWDMQELEKRQQEIVANNELKVRLRVGGPPDLTEDRRDSKAAAAVANFGKLLRT